MDRDGVINHMVRREGSLSSPRVFSEFCLMDGVSEAMAAFHAANYLLLVVTNQPEIARGLLPPGELLKMHTYITQALPIDDLRVCVHDDDDGCACRKPKPGMLLELAAKWNVDLKASFMIGDTWKDMEAGQKAQVTTCLLDRTYNKEAVCVHRMLDLGAVMRAVLAIADSSSSISRSFSKVSK